MTIKGKMAELAKNVLFKLDNYESLNNLNFLDDALNVYTYIYPNKETNYVDPDYYSPLLYEVWGRILLRKGILNSYEVQVKNYRFVLAGKYSVDEKEKNIILGTDGMLSKRKCNEYENIRDYRYAGGFAIWPSHRGGINFRKLRYKDDIYKTLDDIKGFYSTKEKNEYNGVIGKNDYEWFDYINSKGKFEDIFFFEDYNEHRGELLEFEKERANRILKYLQGVNIL